MALLLLNPVDMPDQNDESISKKVIYEHVTSSGGKQTGIVIAVLLVLAIIIVAFIFTRMGGKSRRRSELYIQPDAYALLAAPAIGHHSLRG